MNDLLTRKQEDAVFFISAQQNLISQWNLELSSASEEELANMYDMSDQSQYAVECRHLDCYADHMPKALFSRLKA